jgi:hypothetical protein
MCCDDGCSVAVLPVFVDSVSTVLVGVCSGWCGPCCRCCICGRTRMPAAVSDNVQSQTFAFTLWFSTVRHCEVLKAKERQRRRQYLLCVDTLCSVCCIFDLYPPPPRWCHPVFLTVCPLCCLVLSHDLHPMCSEVYAQCSRCRICSVSACSNASGQVPRRSPSFSSCFRCEAVPVYQLPARHCIVHVLLCAVCACSQHG